MARSSNPAPYLRSDLLDPQDNWRGSDSWLPHVGGRFRRKRVVYVYLFPPGSGLWFPFFSTVPSLAWDVKYKPAKGVVGLPRDLHLFTGVVFSFVFGVRGFFLPLRFFFSLRSARPTQGLVRGVPNTGNRDALFFPTLPSGLLFCNFRSFSSSQGPLSIPLFPPPPGKPVPLCLKHDPKKTFSCEFVSPSLSFVPFFLKVRWFFPFLNPWRAGCLSWGTF